MAFNSPALNPSEPMTNADRTPAFKFLVFMRGLRADVQAAPAVQPNPVLLTSQNASIGTTAMPTDGTLSAGLYRVTVYQEITVADGVSSSLQTSLSWTSNAGTKTKAGTAVTGNTTATTDSFSVLMHIDADTPISYTTTYASNTPGQMRYTLAIVLERLSVDA